MTQPIVLVTGCTEGGIGEFSLDNQPESDANEVNYALGYGLCKQFSLKGCRVYATARRVENMSGLEDPEPTSFSEFKCVKIALDVTDQNSIQTAVQKVIAEAGRIDILINNAGMPGVGALMDISYAEAHACMETNVFGTLSMCQAVATHMIKQGSGKIVNIGSVAGYVSPPWAGIYAMSKAAVHSMSDVLRLELKPFGISVTVVAPGAIKSNFGKNATKQVSIPENSFYTSVAQRIYDRANMSQNSTPADVFGAEVARRVLRPSPPSYITYGKLSMVYAGMNKNYSFEPPPSVSRSAHLSFTDKCLWFEVDTDSEIAHTLRRFGPSCIISFSSEAIRFIKYSDDLSGVQTIIKAEAPSLVSNYRVESSQNNEINLVIELDGLMQATKMAQGCTNIQLQLRRNEQQPFLDWSMTSTNRAGSNCSVNCETTVTLLTADQMRRAQEPLVTAPNVNILLPDLMTLKQQTLRLQTFSEYIDISANKSGELKFGIDTDMATMEMKFTHQDNPQIAGQSPPRNEEDREEFYTVRAKTEDIANFLDAYQLEPENAVCSITDRTRLVFFLYSNIAKFQSQNAPVLNTTLNSLVALTCHVPVYIE
ncbi:hypothetical protein DFQ28_004824 [Apophysomyces sp. BC1034]|nr:hypothetical protein DFQ28_004824 [Apophysomyces sp. BC1034]